MKTKVIKFLGAALIAAFAQNANAQWTWASPNVELINPSDNVGLGLTPAFKLDVKGDVNIDVVSSYRIGGSIMLRTDALTTTYVGTGAGMVNTGDHNTFVGSAAGINNTTGEWNTVLGRAAMFENITGKDNTIMGAAAGRYIKMSGNTAIGSNALHNNIGGAYNTAVGDHAGGGSGANETGTDNTFLGAYAGNSNKNGNSNVYLGGSSANLPSMNNRNQNTFVGGFTNLAGDDNIAMGYKAGGPTGGTGSRNLLFGNHSKLNGTGNLHMGYLTDGAGNYNVLLGYEGITNGGDNSIAIGSYVNNTGGYNINLGYYSTNVGSDNVSMGTNTNNSGTGNTILGAGTSTTIGLSNATAIGYNTQVATDNTLVLGDYNQNTTTVIGSNGRYWGWGAYQLEVNGDAYATGSWFPSDANFKKNIKAYNNAMDVINKLNPVSYYYKDDVYFDHKDKDGKQVKRNFAKEEQIGFLAQDLEKVLPNMVRTHKDGTKAVNYNQLFGVLTQGMKEQIAITESLKEENTKLATLINELAISNKELKSRLDAIEQKAGNSNIDTKKEIPADLKGKIEQIAPNPFSENVVVNYFVPQTATKASMVLRSDKATQSVSFDINNKGNNSITLSGTNLLTGLYLCELYVDGQLVDTQKIMLVK